MRIKSLICKNF